MKKYQYLASWDDQTLTRVGEPVVVLGDSNVSQVEVTLPSNFLFDPTKAECRMYFLLPGEKESEHDVLETATKDDNGDSHVTWTIKHVHSQKGGRLAFSLAIIGDNAQWDSQTAIIPVYESRYQPESEEAEEPYTGRLDALEGTMASIRGEFAEVQEDFEDLKETATLGTPTPESLVANMQEGRVYIYTGTEPGYTAGHVYYYVGGALTDGGVYGGVNVDTTLTQSGQAADAKVTGDEIEEIKEDLSDVTEDTRNLFSDINVFTASNITISNGVVSGACNAFYAAFGANGGYIPIDVTFDENTQYTLSLMAYTDQNQGSAGNGLVFVIRYTDNTTQNMSISNGYSTYTRKTITTTAEKTVAKISCSYGSNGNNIWHIKDIQLEKGNIATGYIEPTTAIDRIAREDIAELQNNLAVLLGRLNNSASIRMVMSDETISDETISDETISDETMSDETMSE